MFINIYNIYILIKGYYAPLSTQITEMNLCTCVPVSDCLTCHKIRKSGSLGRKNFFPGQGEKINENILKIFVKIFGGMKNIY